jgi:uncharacterized damage-inducible protein DinB
MTISETLLPEFDQEMGNTRKTLERVPDDRFDWKPHPKSMPMGNLANHLATIPNWASITVNTDSLDLAPPDGSEYPREIATSQKQLLELFDRKTAEARAAIAGTTDEHLMKPWSLLMGGKTMMTLPRAAVLRSFVMNHTIHHRAQLGVYLRLNDISVPGMYGPSADEKEM